MGKKVRIEGMDRLLEKLERLPEVIDNVAGDALKEISEDGADDVRANAPVLSGNLKRSVQAESPKGKKVQIAITADYAQYVIHGTSRQNANDFTALPIAHLEVSGPKTLYTHVKAALDKL